MTKTELNKLITTFYNVKEGASSIPALLERLDKHLQTLDKESWEYKQVRERAGSIEFWSDKSRASTNVAELLRQIGLVQDVGGSYPSGSVTDYIGTDGEEHIITLPNGKKYGYTTHSSKRHSACPFDYTNGGLVIREISEE